MTWQVQEIFYFYLCMTLHGYFWKVYQTVKVVRSQKKILNLFDYMSHHFGLHHTNISTWSYLGYPTTDVNSNDPQFIKWDVRFTTVPSWNFVWSRMNKKSMMIIFNFGFTKLVKELKSCYILENKNLFHIIDLCN